MTGSSKSLLFCLVSRLLGFHDKVKLNKRAKVQGNV